MLGARLAIIIAIVVAVCPVCMLCFVSAHLIARPLGRTGNAVLSRVCGMLLAACSVQFVINGIGRPSELFLKLRQSANSLILRHISRLDGAGGKTAPDPGRFLLHCHIALTYFRSNKRHRRKVEMKSGCR